MIHTYLTKLAKNDSLGHILFLTAATLTAKLGLKSNKLDVYFKNLPFPSPKYPSIMARMVPRSASRSPSPLLAPECIPSPFAAPTIKKPQQITHLSRLAWAPGLRLVNSSKRKAQSFLRYYTHWFGQVREIWNRCTSCRGSGS
jgi:hypothetical protein